MQCGMWVACMVGDCVVCVSMHACVYSTDYRYCTIVSEVSTLVRSCTRSIYMLNVKWLSVEMENPASHLTLYQRERITYFWEEEMNVSSTFFNAPPRTFFHLRLTAFALVLSVGFGAFV